MRNPFKAAPKHSRFWIWATCTYDTDDLIRSELYKIEKSKSADQKTTRVYTVRNQEVVGTFFYSQFRPTDMEAGDPTKPGRQLADDMDTPTPPEDWDAYFSPDYRGGPLRDRT